MANLYNEIKVRLAASDFEELQSLLLNVGTELKEMAMRLSDNEPAAATTLGDVDAAVQLFHEEIMKMIEMSKRYDALNEDMKRKVDSLDERAKQDAANKQSITDLVTSLQERLDRLSKDDTQQLTRLQVNTGAPATPSEAFGGHLLRTLPSGVTSQQVTDFWSMDSTGLTTIWGDPHIVAKLKTALQQSKRRLATSDMADDLDRSIAALRTSLSDIFKYWGVSINLEIILRDLRWPEWVAEVAERVFDEQDSVQRQTAIQDFVTEATKPEALTTAGIQVLLRILQVFINEQRDHDTTGPCPDLKLACAVRSHEYGGIRVVSEPLEGIDDNSWYVWLCSEDGYAQNEMSTLPGWNLGQRWAAVAIPGSESFQEPKRVAQAKSTMKRKIAGVVSRPSEESLDGLSLQAALMDSAFEEELGILKTLPPHVRPHSSHLFRDPDPTPEERSSPSDLGQQNDQQIQVSKPPRRGFSGVKDNFFTGFGKLNLSGGASKRPKFSSSIRPGIKITKPELEEKFGQGELVYIGSTDETLPDDVLSPDLRSYLQSDAHRQKRLTYYDKREDLSVMRCLESFRLGEDKRSPWTDRDGPCDRCQDSGGFCAILVAFDLVLIKSSGGEGRLPSSQDDGTLPDAPDNQPQLRQRPSRTGLGTANLNASATTFRSVPMDEPPAGTVLPNPPRHYGTGTKIWVGPPTKDEKDVKNKSKFDAVSLGLLTKNSKQGTRNDHAFHRRETVKKNSAELALCLATQANKEKNLGWGNEDGPCDNCENLERQCIVMIDEQTAWLKGTGKEKELD